jgi:hypothetical protein
MLRYSKELNLNGCGLWAAAGLPGFLSDENSLCLQGSKTKPVLLRSKLFRID